jgi:hypothetical protein
VIGRVVRNRLKYGHHFRNQIPRQRCFRVDGAAAQRITLFRAVHAQRDDGAFALDQKKGTSLWLMSGSGDSGNGDGR